MSKLIFILLTKVIRMIPFSFIVKISAFLGSLAYFIDFKHRKLSLMNLDIAFPGLGKKEKKKIAQGHFVNLIRTTMEFLSLPKINNDNFKKYVRHEGKENFARAYDKGKGVLFLAAHYGNWELMAYVHPFIFAPAANLARKFKNENVDEFINKIRCFSGNSIIDKKNALYQVLKDIKQGKAIGVLMDQSVHPNEAVYVDFFGKFTSTTPFIAQIAIKTGCTIVPVFDFPQKDGGHIIRYYPEIDMNIPADNTDAVICNTERLNKFIEERVKSNPELWLWSHDRWKNISDGRCWGRIKKKEESGVDILDGEDFEVDEEILNGTC